MRGHLRNKVTFELSLEIEHESEKTRWGDEEVCEKTHTKEGEQGQGQLVVRCGQITVEQRARGRDKSFPLC